MRFGFNERVRLILFALLVIMLMPVANWAQELPEVSNTLFFVGVKHEGSTAPVYGGGGAVGGSNFWIFGYTSMTNDTAEAGEVAVSTPLSAEVAYLYPVNENLHVGLTVSPLTIDWANVADANWRTYLNNTTGAIVSYNVSRHITLAGWAKYKWNFGNTEFEKEGGARTAFAVVGAWRL